ncbi:glycosyltransferase family 4 protein [Marisediminicola sp. LYQ85]|uniref:glycosyltransferase family 4 protein n=1 Tax=Marisediminicola sp. LYQ85 TaxID=3391062 RepID=UPI0039833BE1
MDAIGRVAILSLHYPPEASGNAPYVGGLAEGLRARGARVSAITTHPHYPAKSFDGIRRPWTSREDQGGVSVKRLSHARARTSSNTNRLAAELSFGVRLVFARWNRPDAIVVVSPGLFPSAMALLRARLIHPRTRVVMWVQDIYTLGLSETGSGSAASAKIIRLIEAWSFRRADHLVVIHPRFAEYATTHLGMPTERIEVIRNWTHLTPQPQVDRETTRSKLGWRPDETVILHAGNMGVKQGLENVVAAARLADKRNLPLRFVLLGDGNQRARLEVEARGIDRIDFLDPLADDEFVPALHSADVLLINEQVGVAEMSVPSKLTSYFDTGLPVVACTASVGATADEMNASEGGLIVGAGNPEQLIEACLALREAPVTATTLGTNGKAYRSRVLDSRSALDRFGAAVAGTE